MDDRPARAERGGGDPAALDGGCILALDTLALILIALLVLYAAANRSYYMDAALVLSLLAFGATLVLARYHEERRVF